MELEIKFKVNDNNTINPIDKGYTAVKESHQIDSYVLVNKIINGKRTYFRYREDILKETYSCDFHQIISDYATDEKEIPLQSKKDLVLIEQIHQELGLSICCVVDKHRKSFTMGDLTLVIDKVKGLGTFIELELMGADIKENRLKLESEIQRLGLAQAQRIQRRGYPDLVLESQL